MIIRRFLKPIVLLLTCCEFCAFSYVTAKSESVKKWENEYQAYGRTIKIKVDISVPEKDIYPFIAIEPTNELSAEEIDSYKELFDTLNSSDIKDTFRSIKNEIIISYSDHKSHPDLSNPDKVTTPSRSMIEYDGNTAYAENNDLTVNEAEDLVRKNIQMVFPSMDFQIHSIVINDRTKYRKTGEKITNKGNYGLNCMQVVDNVPVAANVHCAYRFSRAKRDLVIGNYGSALVNVEDQNNYSAYYTLWDKKAELGTPEQLLSFDSIKPQIEKMIMSGNIRNVYHVYLGYAQYDLPQGNKYAYVLSPAWVIWVDWVDTPQEEIDRDTENGTGLYMDWYGYKPIIANAVTGEVTNPLDESEGRMLLPADCMKYVEDY